MQALRGSMPQYATHTSLLPKANSVTNHKYRVTNEWIWKLGTARLFPVQFLSAAASPH